MAGFSINTLSAAADRVGQSLVGSNKAKSQAATQATDPSTAATGTTATGTQITSADFLTLLVTEMKNQDPTQPTDPNAYIQQLVGVNSLQQLIAINKTLSSGTGSSTTAVQAAPVTTF